MVGLHRAMVRSAALLAALFVVSTDATPAPQPATELLTTPTPTPTSVPPVTAPASTPAATAILTPLTVPRACTPGIFKLVGNKFDISCNGESKGGPEADRSLNLDITVESSELEIWSLTNASLDRLHIHSGQSGSRPTVRFGTNFTGLMSITSLSFSRINFLDESVVLKIPDSVAYLKIESTNAEDVSLDISNNSGLKEVDFIENAMEKIPKCLYERNYTPKLAANVTITNNDIQRFRADIIDRLRININTTSSNLEFEKCESDMSANGTIRVCELLSSTNTPAPSSGSSAPVDNSAKSSSSSNTTLIVIITVVAVVVVVVGAVLFRKLQRGKGSARDDNSVNLIGKEDVSGNGKLSFISSDESLRALRLQQHEVTLTKSLGTGRLWLGKFADANVLVKRIEAEVSDAYVTKNLMNQAQALATLSHENIVSLLGVTWLAGTDFAVVAEFMDKSNLKHMLADASWQLDIHTKLRMCMDIAQGLAYLHDPARSMYVHSFSSRKVLVNSSSECKLNLFDIYPSATKFETLESYGAGEIAWLAPELITHSSPQDPRKINMYAFGVVICEILARAAPYQSLAEEKGNTLSDIKIVQRIRRQEPLAPHESRHDYMRAPQSLRDAVERCLSLSPMDRPSANDIIAVLEVAKAEVTATQQLV